MKKLLILLAVAALVFVGCAKDFSFDTVESKKDVIDSGVAPEDIAAWESEVDADFAAVLAAIGTDDETEALASFDAKYGTDMTETGARFAAARFRPSPAPTGGGSGRCPA